MTPNHPDLDPAFLARYFAGEASPDQARRFEAWVAEQPEREAVLAELRETWRVSADLNRTSFNADAAWHNIQAAIAARPALRLSIPPRSRPARLARWIAIAASVVLAVGGSLAGYRLLHLSSTPLATPEPIVHTITTDRGQRMALRLADGTGVLLAPASRLRFSADYGVHDRSVQLEGEAVFTVVHDERKPFSVRTSRLVARDLGTRFVVRAYAEDSAAQVVVAEGKVAVSRNSSAGSAGALLARGDAALVSGQGEPTLAHGVSLDSYFAWTEGRLVFRRARLGEAIRQIERWYDIEIHLASSDLDNLGFTASFPTEESAGEMLDVLTAVLQLDAERSGPRSYTLIRRAR